MEEKFEDSDEIFQCSSDFIETLHKSTESPIELLCEETFISKSEHEAMVTIFMHPEFPVCKILLLAVEKIKKKFPGINFYKVDVLQASEVSKRLEIKIVPFMGYFKNGYYVGSHIGFEKIGNNTVDSKLLVDEIGRHFN